LTVYVDKTRNPLGRMIMCHMMADSLEELHDMADRIGMRRDWFQPKSSPHYDVSLSRRARAIEYGAIEATRRDIVRLIRHYKPSQIKKIYWLRVSHCNKARLVKTVDGDAYVCEHWRVI